MVKNIVKLMGPGASLTMEVSSSSVQRRPTQEIWGRVEVQYIR